MVPITHSCSPIRIKWRRRLSWMTFALCLQVPNHIKFKRYSDIYTNFIPQIIFLQSIFGYLVLCILYKWSIDWSTASIQPPSLLNMLIAMFLQPGSVPAESQMYRGQGTIQLVLLMTAAICVPWLLIAKPYLLWKEMHKTQDYGYVSLNRDDSAADDIPLTCLLRLTLDWFLIPGGASWFWRSRHPSNYPHHRILPWMYLPYCILPATLGPFTGACATFGSVVVYDTWRVSGTDVHHGLDCIDRCGSLLVYRHCCCAVYHRGLIGILTCSPITLGRIQQQAFWGRWTCVCSFEFCESGE